MAELPTLPVSADDPDGSGYKGRRAEQDSAQAAPMAPNPLGGLAQPAAAGPGGGGPADQLGQVAGQAPPVSPPASWGQAAVAGHGGDQAAAAGLAPDGGPAYGLGAVYAPGSGAPAPAPGGYPPAADPTGPVAAPQATTLAESAGGATAFDRSGTALADPGLAPAPPAPPVVAGPPEGSGPAVAPPPAWPPAAGGPDHAADGVSFHPDNLDALLSGHPGAAPSPGPLGAAPSPGHPDPAPSPGPLGATSGADAVGAGDSAGSGISVSVDGAAVPVGDGAVRVAVGGDGTATVRPDPVGPAGPGDRVAAGTAHGGQGGAGPAQPAQPAQPGQPTAPPDATQVLHGTGADPANVALTVDTSTLGQTPVQVVHNADGSLDLRVAGANGHQVDVHVDHGSHVDIALSRDAHGNLLVRADPVEDGDTAAGGGTGAVPGTGPAGQLDTPGADPPAGPDDPPGADAAGPAAAPDGSAPPGLGGPPPGGMPGGGGPTGGGGLPGGGAPTGPTAGPAGTGPGSTGSGNGTVKADPAAIKKLGTDLTNHAGPMLESAHRRTGDISVGFPAFGVLGLPLNMAHEQVKNTAQSYLAAGRNQLDSWRTALNQTANNYRDAEDSSTVDGG